QDLLQLRSLARASVVRDHFQQITESRPKNSRRARGFMTSRMARSSCRREVCEAALRGMHFAHLPSGKTKPQPQWEKL
ncbi:MAG: hypothetical protein ACREV2_16470, partial [Burkholderiales bacterium]